MNGKLIIFTAPSGAGKTTIVKYLCSQIDRIDFSISATTRERRMNEIEGKDYYFLTNQEFLHKIAHKEFVEFEEVYAGTYYGTLLTEIERIWSTGKQVIFDIDVQGALRLKKKYGDHALAIFVKPPSLSVLIDRLTLRDTESKEKIQERINKAKLELSYENQFDRVLLNEDLNLACEQALNWVKDFIIP